ncbi:MAG: single-stranded DNA-binding protein [Candidatus Njordarchaeia archaeon]
MKEESQVKIEELKPNRRRLNLKVKVLEIGEKKDIVSRNTGEMHRIVETLVGDETGTVKLTLWDDKVNSLEVGKTYELKNANTTIYQGGIRLNVGKYSEILEAEEDIPEEEINKENNVSDKEIPYTQRKWRGNYNRRRY